MLGMGLDCPRVKPRGIAAAAGESGLGAPSGDAGLGRFNLHSVEIWHAAKGERKTFAVVGLRRLLSVPEAEALHVCLDSQRPMG